MSLAQVHLFRVLDEYVRDPQVDSFVGRSGTSDLTCFMKLSTAYNSYKCMLSKTKVGVVELGANLNLFNELSPVPTSKWLINTHK